jgi:hypothetical protein
LLLATNSKENTAWHLAGLRWNNNHIWQKIWDWNKNIFFGDNEGNIAWHFA